MLENIKCDTPNSRARSANNYMEYTRISSPFHFENNIASKKNSQFPVFPPCQHEPLNPGNAKATKTAAIPPFPYASKIFLIVSGLFKSPCTNSNNQRLNRFGVRLSKALEDDALGFRVSAKNPEVGA